VSADAPLAIHSPVPDNPIDIPREFRRRGVPSMRYPDDDRYDRYADDDPRDFRPRRRKKRRHSELGIASCAVAVLAGAVIFLTFVFAGVVTAREGDLNENDPRAMAAGCALFTGGALALIGVVLGIVGVMQQRRIKLFAGLGLGFNACIVLGVATITILGMVT